MRSTIFFCVMMLLVTSYYAMSSPFAVTHTPTAISRNEVKEAIGTTLHTVADTAGVILSTIGRMMMQIGALQRVTVDHVSALVEDTPPFNTASTVRLQKAHSQLAHEARELQKIVAHLDQVAGRIACIVKCEDVLSEKC